MAWVKVDGSTGDHQVFVSKWFACPGDWNGSYIIEMAPDSITPLWSTQIGVAGHSLASGITVANGGWFHVAGTYDGLVKKIYVDGQQTGTYGWIGSLLTNNNPLQLGRHNLGTCQPWEWNWLNGALDEVKIYNRALTGQEIREQAGIWPVGGIQHLPDIADSALRAGESSGASSGPRYAALAGAGAALTIALGFGRWHVRRRRLR
jgi:hypothetical protein